MHILFVVSSFFPKHKAGTENYVRNLSNQLIKQGKKVSIVFPEKTHKPYQYVFENIPVYVIPENETPNPKTFVGLHAPSNLKWFTQLLNELKPDIVHFHINNRLINSYHYKACKNRKIATLYSPHLSGIFCKKGNLLYLNKKVCDGKVKLLKCQYCYLSDRFKSLWVTLPVTAFTYLYSLTGLQKKYLSSLHIIHHKKKELQNLNKYIDKVIAISPWIEKTFRINGVNQVTHVNQTITISNTQTSELINDKFVITYIGRISKIKGIHILLEALKIIQKENTVQLNLIGIQVEEEINYYHQLKETSKEIKHIQWFENLNSTEINQVLSYSHMLCLPSIVAEMAPLTILEAKATGVPTIGSNIGGIADMIEHGKDGLLFEMNNTNDLAKNLLKCIHDDNFYKQLRQNVKPPLPFSSLVEEHIDIYNSLTDKAS